MSIKKYTWHKIADSIAEITFSSSGLAEITVNGKTFCIAMHNDIVYACTQKCPHAGGELVDGYVDSTGNIVCPLHRYKFNLENGRNVSGEGYYLKTFPVEVRTEGIFVGIADGGLFSWLK